MHRVHSTWANCAPGLKWKFIASLVALVLGLILVGVAISLHVVLNSVLDNGIKDFLVVDSKSNSTSYEEWEFNGIPEDRTPQFMRYYLWNLTNAEEVLNVSSSAANASVIPRYERVGPFVYRRFTKRVNVSFVEDGEQVYYAQYIYYTFDDAQSVGQPDDPALRVTNLNTAYMGVMAQVGSEQNLVRAMLGPTLRQLFTSLGQPFGYIIAEVTTSKMLPVVRQAVLQGIMNAANVSEPEAAQIFASTWANETAPNPQLWGTLGVLSQGSQPSQVSAAAVAQLWDSASPLPNLVNATFSSALLWLSAGQDPTTRQTLGQLFGLDDAQMQMVLAWRAKFLASSGVPQVYQTFGISDLSDLIYLQWGEAAVTNGTSVRQLLAGSPLAQSLVGTPEFAVWARDTLGPDAVTFNATFARNLLNNSATGLFETTNVAAFLTLVALGDDAQLRSRFGLSLAQAGQVARYLSYVGETYVDAALRQAFAAGGGLVTTRTPQEWLWGVEDPLLKLLGAATTTVALATNMTSEADALNGRFTSLHYTGKGDINNIARYINYCGVRVYPAGTLWAEDEVVDGTEGIQFRPFLESSNHLVVWSYELMRQIPFDYDESVSLKGIDLYRYHVTPSFFLPQPKYYQTITGFANMSNLYSGVPAFISKPNMLDCEAEWRDKLDGMTPSDIDDTLIDVEPYTGYTMNVAKQLQLNLYMQEAGSPLDLYNKAFLKEVIYPIFYASEQATISDAEADDFKNQVYLLITVRVVVFWVGIAVGSVLAAIGLVALVFVILKNRTFIRGYEVIGEQSDPLSGDDPISSRRRVLHSK